MNRQILALGLGAVLLAAGPPVRAQAQPGYGDLVVTGYTGSTRASLVLLVDSTLQRFTTLRKTGAGEVDQWVGMLDDNRNLGILTWDINQQSGVLFSVSPTGQSRRLGSIKAPFPQAVTNDPTGAVWDPEGRLIISAGRSLYRWDPMAPGLITTLFSFPTVNTLHPYLQAVTVGPGPTGHFHYSCYALSALPEFQSPSLPATRLYRFDPRTSQFAPLSLDPGLVTGTAFSFRYGAPNRNTQFLLTRGHSSIGTADLLSVDFFSGSSTTLARFNAFLPTALRYTQRNTVWIAGSSLTPPTISQVAEVDLTTGQVIRTAPLKGLTGFRATGLEIYGTNLLQLTGQVFLQVDAPLVMSLQTNDASLAHKPYLLALAFESSPPFQLTLGSNTVWINLALDPLLWMSLNVPGAIGLTGNAGVTDAMGNATATLSLPPGYNTGGLTIYAAWIIYDQTNIYRVSESELFVLP